jgi:hypothetical protein
MNLLSNQGRDHLPPLIRKPHAQALERQGEPAVVEAELVQNRRMKIVDVDGILGDGPAQLVGGAVRDAWLDPAASHPQAKRARMMIAADFIRQFAAAILRQGRTTELAGENHHRRIEQTPLL